MYLGIRKLNVLGSVLYIAAHPDDENTRLIAYFSKEKLFRTGYLSLTRGDGGQNLIGDEQGIDLGLIRTQELLAARRIDGGEQFFSRAFDFGYSKNPEETFTKWDREKILADVVWVIRQFQPDVIITRFPTTGEGGHGHHTASAILANEAFTAAADPSRFPEQLAFVHPWQAKRILWNTFNFGTTNTTSTDQFKFDVGGFNPLLGKSYGEIAAISRSNHKSQGFGSAASRGEALEYFKTTGGKAPSTDIMDDVDLSWNRVKGAESIQSLIDSIGQQFDLVHPEKSVQGLVRLYAMLKRLPEGYWKTQKIKETLILIEQCSGLFMDVVSAEPFVVQTDSARLNFSFNNRLGANVNLKEVIIDNNSWKSDQALIKNRNIFFSRTIYVSADKPITQPYWLRNKMEPGYFNVTDQQKIGQPDADPAYTARIIIEVEGQELEFEKPVRYKFTDPVRGELYWPTVVVPPVSFKDFDRVYLKGIKERTVEVSLVANKKMNIPALDGKMPDQPVRHDTLSKLFSGMSLQKGQYVMQTWKDEELDTAVYRINVAPYVNRPGSIQVSITHEHIPAINYFKDAYLTVKKIDVKTFNKKIGYIVGAGDKVPEALEQMGYDVTLLSEKDLSKGGLDKYDVIITGVRTYNTHEWMNKYYDKLMKYISDGGNLIVQYNTSNNIGPIRARIGPFDFDITRNRVTDENAKVTILKPDHPVFNFPNKITDEDFKGWIQERSIYHARDTSGKYEKLIGMADPGESSDDGSLIVARYGKGWFVYTGIVFFRELPAAVPGAYRLIANIIALNKKKGF
jgi:LmbE family N-acetylglucosaminyl deacetylase